MTEASNQLSFQWVDGVEPLSDMVEEWIALADRVGADIYANPVWVLTWWMHFGQGRTLRALVVRNANGHLVALIPFMIHAVWLGPIRIRIAKLAATDPNTVVFRLAAEEWAVTPSLTEALSDLLGRGCADLISFTPASERGQVLHAARDAVAHYASSHPPLALQDRAAGTHTVFELPGSFDGYLSRLSKKRRNQYRRDLKRLQSDHGLTTQVTHPDAVQFQDFVRFHNQQWEKAGRGGHCTDWGGSEAFYSELAKETLTSGKTWFVEQHGHSSALATQFCLVSGQVCHWRLPARSTDPELERLSLGKIGLVQMIEELIEGGITRIEAGIGDYGYKLIYGGEAVPTHRLIISRQSGFAAIRLKLCLGWARLLHLAYYRLWFGRLTPRLRAILPLRHKPLWAAWVRTRI